MERAHIVCNLKITGIRNQRTGALTTLQEWIRIENVGPIAWILAGWLITDQIDGEESSHTFTLPATVGDQLWELAPGEMLLVITGQGTDHFLTHPIEGGNPQFHVYLQRDAFIWTTSGAQVSLRHPSGQFATKPFAIP
jgi:hypothetical protein